MRQFRSDLALPTASVIVVVLASLSIPPGRCRLSQLILCPTIRLLTPRKLLILASRMRGDFHTLQAVHSGSLRMVPERRLYIM